MPYRQKANKNRSIRKKALKNKDKQPGFLTKHHPKDENSQNRKSKFGAVERKEVLKWRAMELKIQGLNLSQIGQRLAVEFELEEAVQLKTVDNWLDETFANTITAKEIDADRHAKVIFTRGEGMIRELLPIAMGLVQISRKRVRDGETVEVLDEKCVAEKIASIGEIRKIMDQQIKMFRIGAQSEDGEASINGHSLTLLVEKTVTNNIMFPGQPQKTMEAVTLQLSSGDPDIDTLDAEALTVEPI